jgi:hypothetical protein
MGRPNTPDICGSCSGFLCVERISRCWERLSSALHDHIPGLPGAYTPLSKYFTDPQFFRYFGNMIGWISFRLPGVSCLEPFTAMARSQPETD